MAVFDERAAPQIQDIGQSQKTLTREINEQIRLIYRELNFLQGRLGETTVRDHLRVSGRLVLDEDSSTDLHEEGCGEVQFNGLKLSLAPTHAVRVYRSTNLSIPNNALTTVDFSHQLFDTGPTTAYLWRAADPTKLYITQTGLWLIGATLRYASNAIGDRALRINADQTSGSTQPEIVVEQRVPATSAAATTLSASALYSFTSQGHVIVQAFQDSGAALNLSATTLTSQITLPSLWAFRLFSNV